MAAPALKSLIVPASSKHTATVIFSHGLGDTSAGWSFLAETLGPKIPFVKWILPNAPVQAVTLNMGMRMPSWYQPMSRALSPPQFDIAALDAAGNEDERGMLESVRAINQIVGQEVDSGISPARIIIGGFSQGAVVSLLCGLTSERKLGGVVVLSGFLPLRSKLPSMRTDVSKDLPIFWGHGDSDPVVRYSWGTASLAALRDKLKMPNVRFDTYKGMEHSACPQELKDLEGWLAERLPKEEAAPQEKI